MVAPTNDGAQENLLDKGSEPPPKASLRQLFRYSSVMDRIMYITGCLVSVATGLGMPLMAIVIGDVTQNFMDYEFHRQIGDLNDAELNSQFRTNVTSSCVNFISIGTGVFIAATLQCICFLIASENTINRLRRQFFLSVVRQDTTWFDKNQSGTLATKLFDNIERVKEGCGDKIGLLVQYVSLFLGGFAVAFAYNWKLTLIMMSLAPFMLVCGAAITKLVANAATEETQKYAVAGSIAQEVLTAIRTVVVFNAQERECARYDKALNEGKLIGIKKSLFLGVGVAATYLIMFSFYGLAFWVGTDFVAEGKISGGTVMVVFFSVMMGAMSLGQAGPQFAIIGTAQGAAGALYEIIDREPEIDAYQKHGVKCDNLVGRIKISDLEFTYPTRTDVPILKGVSFEVGQGETVALVGSSGCGKSTILQLLLRYYNSTSGNITIDDIPIENYNLEFLRQSIGVVSQEPNLFNTTIEENIRYGRYEVSEEEMKTALKQANAYEFVKGLPEGIRTRVGDRGAQLSGGQKQRIAIARALVRNPKILLLDEATSALDAESEHIVQKALEKASKGRTTIVIAHRLSTIKNADKIIVLKAGEIHEVGTHNELLAKKGLYHELVNAQVFTEFEVKKPSRQFSAMSVRSHSTTSAGPQSPLLLKTQLSTLYDRPVTKEDEEKEDELARLKRECKEEGIAKANFRSIIRHARPEWTLMIIALCIAAVEGCVFPTFSLFFAQIIQVFAEPDPAKLREDGHFWALMFPLLGVIETIFTTSQCVLFGISSERLTMRLRSNVFRNVLRMDGAYFDKASHSPGKISTRLATDAPNVRSALDNRLGSVFGSVVQVICGISIAFYFGWKMAIVVICIFPLAAVGQFIEIKYMEGRITKDTKELENSGKIAMEAIENIRTVQALTLEHRMHEQFCKHLDGPHTTNTRKAVIQGFSYGFAAGITYFLYAISFLWGLWLILNNEIMSQDVLRVLFAISFTADSLGSATTYFPEYIKATFAGGLINRMLKETPTIDGMTKDGAKPAIAGSICFKDVHFTYPERQDTPILQGLGIEVSPGETLALVGPSGCGKSTVISLLERLYDPCDGQILIDGSDLRKMNSAHLRDHIALVSQEPILFDTSIKENICYGMKEEISIKKITEVAQQANIHNFISSLPQGYDTRVGDKGTQLSGGQKQRIAIARALLRNPKILLLDEATSALDTESEKQVQEALEFASAGRTCVVVAHRLSTVVKADRIVVMDSGRVVEQGTHKELLALKGTYWNLTQKQGISPTL